MSQVQDPAAYAQDATNTQLRSARFRREREASWKALEALLAKVEGERYARLSLDEAQRLAQLYREATASLAVARAISMDKALLTYLNGLCARAYLVVYARRIGLFTTVGNFFLYAWPQAVRAAWPALLMAFLAIGFGGWMAWMLFMQDSAWFRVFYPVSFSDSRHPGATTQALLDVVYNPPTREGLIAMAQVFSASLFSNNARIAILSFALGPLACVFALLLLAYNGTVIGAVLALYHQHGIVLDKVAWLSIHGVTELTAILMAAAGGMHLGLAFLFPGRQTRAQAMRSRGRVATSLAVGAVLMLFLAAFIEAILRQSIQSLAWRMVIGWGLGVLWLAYFLLAGRGPRRVEPT